MVEYGKDTLNTFLLEEEPLGQPEPASFSISPFELLGKGEIRAKIIIRLKLEELLKWDNLSSSRYVNRMNTQTAKEDWIGFLATNEIASSVLGSDPFVLQELKKLKSLDVVVDKYLVLRNVKVKKNGGYPYTIRIHMWKIHNPLPEQVYRLARIKFNWHDPAELLKGFKESLTKHRRYFVTRK